MDDAAPVSNAAHLLSMALATASSPRSPPLSPTKESPRYQETARAAYTDANATSSWRAKLAAQREQRDRLRAELAARKAAETEAWYVAVRTAHHSEGGGGRRTRLLPRPHVTLASAESRSQDGRPTSTTPSTQTPLTTRRTSRTTPTRRANIEAAEAAVAAAEVERQRTTVVESATPSRACDACPSPQRELRSDLWETGVATRPPPPAPTGPAPASARPAPARGPHYSAALSGMGTAVQAEVGPMPPHPPNPPKYSDDPYSAAEPGSGEPRVVIPPFQPPVPPASGRGFYPEGAFGLLRFDVGFNSHHRAQHHCRSPPPAYHSPARSLRHQR